MSRQEERYNKRRLQGSYFTSIVSISLVLLMIGFLGLLILHAKKLSDYVKENIGFSIMMNHNVKEADIIRLQKSLDATKFVKSTEYITKERAAEILEEDLGEDFVSFIGYTLPPSIDVRLIASYANNDSLAKIEQELLKNKNVKEVYYQKSLVQSINKNIKKISIIILLFSGLLSIIALALINNTIRLSVYSKRFIIRTMQLVGATQLFIRRPFVTRGILHGIYSAFIAIAVLIASIYYFQRELPEIVSVQDIDIFITLFVLVILTGIIITWISTFFAVRKYLRMKTDNLYF
ncbi:cell division protein FtsX [candidate division KSB1 bacterium]